MSLNVLTLINLLLIMIICETTAVKKRGLSDNFDAECEYGSVDFTFIYVTGKPD